MSKASGRTGLKTQADRFPTVLSSTAHPPLHCAAHDQLPGHRRAGAEGRVRPGRAQAAFRTQPRPRRARKLKAIDVIDVLSDLFILRGIPAHIRSDNGPEFVAKAVQDWIAVVGAKTA